MDRRRRRVLIVGTAAALVAGALFAVEWPRVHDWYRPPRPGLPDPTELVSTRAAVWASGSRGYFESDVPEFEVPLDQAVRLWRRLKPNEYDRSPAVDKDHPLGELVGTTADGRVTRVRFYETGGDDVVFTTDGRHFFRAEPRNDSGNSLGGALLLAGTLRTLSLTPARP